MFISAVLVREEAAPLTPTVAVISPVRTALVVNLLQLKVETLYFIVCLAHLNLSSEEKVASLLR